MSNRVILRSFSNATNVRCMVQLPPVRTAAETVQPSDFIAERASRLLIVNAEKGRPGVRLVEIMIKFAVVIFLIGVIVGFYLGMYAEALPGYHGG